MLIELHNKKTLKIIVLRTWCTKKSFGYQIVHHLDTV